MRIYIRLVALSLSLIFVTCMAQTLVVSEYGSFQYRYTCCKGQYLHPGDSEDIRLRLFKRYTVSLQALSELQILYG
jgi:hypothetical protein